MKSAAERVGLVALLGVVALPMVVGPAMMPRDWAPEFVDVVFALLCALRLFAFTMSRMEFLNELGVRLLAELARRLMLGTLPLALSLVHVLPRGLGWSGTADGRSGYAFGQGQGHSSSKVPGD